MDVAEEKQFVLDKRYLRMAESGRRTPIVDGGKSAR